MSKGPCPPDRVFRVELAERILDCKTGPLPKDVLSPRFCAISLRNRISHREADRSRRRMILIAASYEASTGRPSAKCCVHRSSSAVGTSHVLLSLIHISEPTRQAEISYA